MKLITPNIGHDSALILSDDEAEKINDPRPVYLFLYPIGYSPPPIGQRFILEGGTVIEANKKGWIKIGFESGY